jgi:RnfABCDGE-type electron transport complex B subunit
MTVAGILNNIWPAALLMFGLGTGFAIVLLIASIKFEVKQDPLVEKIHAVLPHLDCGACGFAGCAAYAKAVAANPELLGKCTPGGVETANAVAAILNIQISGSGAPLRPIVHCRAHAEDRVFFATYDGIPSCTTVDAVPNVQACKFGCLGYGDCTRACKFDALHVVDGLATVDYEKCTGCAACEKACPRGLIKMVPFTHETMLLPGCNSKENGKNTRSFCAVGCIGCGICAKQSDLFTVTDNLAHMDYARYAPSEATQAAMDKCPTGNIVLRGKNAPAPRKAGEKPAAAKKE